MLPTPPAPQHACKLQRPDAAVLTYSVAPPAATAAPGVALILLHGLASNPSRWSEFVEHSALRSHHALIRLDLRGPGGSAGPGAIGLEVWADDIAAVLDAQGHERAVLVGHSLGAQLGLHFARRNPQRAAGLVLIDPVFRQALHRRWQLLAACVPLLQAAACGVRGLNALGLRRHHGEPLDLQQLDILARRALASPAAEAAFVRHYSSVRAGLRHTRSATYLQDLAEMFRPPPDPAALRLPVLALLCPAEPPSLMRP